MKIIRIERCADCKNLRCWFITKAGIGLNKAVCEKKKFKEIGDWDTIKSGLVSIPEWCPLESLENEKE